MSFRMGNTFKGVIFVIVIFFYSFNSILAQCIHEHTPVRFTSQYNDFSLKYNCLFTRMNDGAVSIKVYNDVLRPQVKLMTEESKILYQEESYFYQDSIGTNERFLVHYIKTKNTNKTKKWFISVNQQFTNDVKIFTLGRCLISIYMYRAGKYRMSKINLFTGEVINYGFDNIHYLGYNDSLVYFTVYNNFRLDKLKFKKGKIYSISENYLAESNLHKLNSVTLGNSPLFYNNVYQITSSYAYSIDYDCIHEGFYYIYVYHNGNVIDSILSSEHYLDIVTQKADTLSIINNSAAFGINTPFVRLYRDNFVIYKWDYNSYNSIVPPIYSESEIYIHGELLFIKTHYLKTKLQGVVSPEGITPNGLVLGDLDTGYYLVTAFDLKENKFIGYPTISYSIINNLD